jgi:hypothetical protein
VVFYLYFMICVKYFGEVTTSSSSFKERLIRAQSELFIKIKMGPVMKQKEVVNTVVNPSTASGVDCHEGEEPNEQQSVVNTFDHRYMDALDRNVDRDDEQF